MVIGIVGSSLSALVAGKKLAQAGHDVTVIEKDRKLGGRLASYNKNGIAFDYGISSIISSQPDFELFMDELKQQNIIKEWASDFGLYDGTQYHKMNPNRPANQYHCAFDGLNAIATYLSRWVDLKSEVQAGGLTYIGANRSKKRPWMINLTDVSVFECDAVILATPAPQAYGILQTARDETPSLRIIRQIDEILYNPCYSVMATYANERTDWKGIECDDATLAWIGNESSKLDGDSETALVIRSSAEFVHKQAQNDSKTIQDILLQKASEIAGGWITQPDWTQLHFWKYFEAVNPINDYFLEMEMDEAPLVLIGDYFKGNSVQDAYLSGNKLAEYWINKYSD